MQFHNGNAFHIDDNHRFLRMVMFSDETTFHLSGKVNSLIRDMLYTSRLLLYAPNFQKKFWKQCSCHWVVICSTHRILSLQTKLQFEPFLELMPCVQKCSFAWITEPESEKTKHKQTNNVYDTRKQRPGHHMYSTWFFKQC